MLQLDARVGVGTVRFKNPSSFAQVICLRNVALVNIKGRIRQYACGPMRCDVNSLFSRIPQPGKNLEDPLRHSAGHEPAFE